jgi:uncharacterized protein
LEVPISLELAAIGIVVLVAAAVQAASGYGFSLMLSPVLQVMGQSINGVRIVNVLSFIVNVVLLAPAYKGANGRRVAALALPAVVLTPVGAWLALHLDNHLIGLVAGFMVVSSAIALLTGLRVRSLRGSIGAVVAGGASGIMNAISGVGGPTVALYTANADWPPKQVIPTTQLYFLAINGTAIFSLGPPVISWVEGLFLLAMLLSGIIVGVRFRRVLSDQALRPAILCLALAGGMTSMVQSITHLSTR